MGLMTFVADLWKWKKDRDTEKAEKAQEKFNETMTETAEKDPPINWGLWKYLIPLGIGSVVGGWAMGPLWGALGVFPSAAPLIGIGAGLLTGLPIFESMRMEEKTSAEKAVAAQSVWGKTKYALKKMALPLTLTAASLFAGPFLTGVVVPWIPFMEVKEVVKWPTYVAAGVLGAWSLFKGVKSYITRSKEVKKYQQAQAQSNKENSKEQVREEREFSKQYKRRHPLWPWVKWGLIAATTAASLYFGGPGIWAFGDAIGRGGWEALVRIGEILPNLVPFASVLGGGLLATSLVNRGIKRQERQAYQVALAQAEKDNNVQDPKTLAIGKEVEKGVAANVINEEVRDNTPRTRRKSLAKGGRREVPPRLHDAV